MINSSRNVSTVDGDDDLTVDPLALAASLESKSSHPLANAVVAGNLPSQVVLKFLSLLWLYR